MSRHWPLFDLVISTDRLQLRLPTEALIDDLVDRVVEGVHRPGEQPFLRPWTQAPRAELPLNLLQHHWRKLAAFTVEDWSLDLAVVVDGVAVGVQGITGRQFPVRREISSGSWLGLRYQGQGLGTEVRAAMLHFAFECLGAEFANSAAWYDNPRSQAVSRKLGYRTNGASRAVRTGEVTDEVNLRLSREDWLAHRAVDVEVSGFETARRCFGLSLPVHA